MYFFNFVSWCRFFVYWYWNFGSCNHFVLFHVLTHVLCISTGMIQLLQTNKIDGTNRHARSTLTVHNTDQLWVCHAFTRRKRAIMWARLLLIGMWGSLRSYSRPGKIKEGERGESAVTSANRFVIRCPQPVRVGSRAMQVVILVPLTGIRCHRWITDLTRQRTSSLRIPTSHQTDTCRYLKGFLLICTKSSLHDWSEHIRALKVGCCK